MAEKKIHPKYYGSRVAVPVPLLCLTWLMLDRLQANGVVQGVVWTIVGFMFVARLLAPFWEEWTHPRDVG